MKEATRIFTESMKKLGHNQEFIDSQIDLVRAGVRDLRLHDNCIILIDAMVKS